MASVHARSWRETYTGLLPEAVIADVVGSQPARIKRWRASLRKPTQRSGALVGEVAGQVAGFVFWGPTDDPGAEPNVAEIYAIYVDPDAIGIGLGRSLLSAAVDDMAAAGRSAAVLWVLDSNDRARRFYEAAGWQLDGEVKAEHRAGGSLEEVRYALRFAPQMTLRDADSGRSPLERSVCSLPSSECGDSDSEAADVVPWEHQ